VAEKPCVGKVVTSTDPLAVREGDGTMHSISLQLLEIRQERSLGSRGALLGALVGFVGGGIYGYATHEDSSGGTGDRFCFNPFDRELRAFAFARFPPARAARGVKASMPAGQPMPTKAVLRWTWAQGDSWSPAPPVGSGPTHCGRGRRSNAISRYWKGAARAPTGAYGRVGYPGQDELEVCFTASPARRILRGAPPHRERWRTRCAQIARAL
jgi:hypothetical protein